MTQEGGGPGSDTAVNNADVVYKSSFENRCVPTPATNWKNENWKTIIGHL